MPKTALKHLAKKAGVSLGRAEHLWDKAGDIVSSEYNEDKDSPAYWALRMGITKRMLGLSEQQKLTFKSFMEAAVGKEPKYEELSVENAVSILNKHCKDSLWMLKENTPIWRGDPDIKFPKSGFLMVNTLHTKRRSQNTSNYYTEILDNHPEMKEFPKRSRSFIASTSRNRAIDYTGFSHHNERPFAIIPYDNAKVGFTHRFDIWDTQIKAFGISRDIEQWNGIFASSLDLEDNIDSFIKFDRALKSGWQREVEKLSNMLEQLYFDWVDLKDEDQRDKEIKKYSKTFLEEVFRAYSPKETGFEWKHPADMKHLFSKHGDMEVWVEGNVVLISDQMWEKLLEAYHGK